MLVIFPLIPCGTVQDLILPSCLTEFLRVALSPMTYTLSYFARQEWRNNLTLRLWPEHSDIELALIFGLPLVVLEFFRPYRPDLRKLRVVSAFAHSFLSHFSFS